MSKPVFHVLGRALAENSPNSIPFQKILESSQIIIGESRKIASRILDKVKLLPEAECFFLDNQNARDEKDLEGKLKKLAREGGTACLFSDMGMPILFDPGAQVLELARKMGFLIRCLPGPTSWGTACALSGWNPPFTLVGFLPQKATDRSTALTQLISLRGHLILMDTPYRFHTLLSECLKAFGPKREAFLAWEIGNPSELYFWESLEMLQKECSARQLKKGEFILIIRDPSVK